MVSDPEILSSHQRNLTYIHLEDSEKGTQVKINGNIHKTIVAFCVVFGDLATQETTQALTPDVLFEKPYQKAFCQKIFWFMNIGFFPFAKEIQVLFYNRP